MTGFLDVLLFVFFCSLLVAVLVWTNRAANRAPSAELAPHASRPTLHGVPGRAADQPAHTAERRGPVHSAADAA